MPLVRLYTDRALRVLVLGGQEALRRGAGEIGTEHLLIGLVRDGQMPPADRRPGADGPRLPLVEARSLGMAALAAVGIGADRLIAETDAALGGGEAARVATLGPAPSDAALPPLGRHARRMVGRQAVQARSLGDNHLSTAHVLLALMAERAGGAHRILAAAGVEGRSALVEVLKQPCAERARLHRQMHELAGGDPSLQQDIVGLMTGTTRESWVTRRRRRRTWPPGEG